MSVRVKKKRNSWFDAITCMFEKMKGGGKTQKSTTPSPTSPKRLGHSRALNTAHRQLICLRHAFQCKNIHCTKSNCQNMKKLLLHISTCKNKDCDATDCITSRRLLSHYRDCVNMECPLCMPIRVVVAQDVCQKRRRLSSGNSKIQGKRRRTESVIALLPAGSPPSGSPPLGSPSSSLKTIYE
jgi:hypothetical protein